MVNKPLLDVKVCLDLLLKRNPHLNQATEIFQLSEHGKIDAVISAISFDTMAYLMQTGFTVPEATEKLKDVALITTVGKVNTTVIENALNAGWEDIEDAIQYYCAEENGCDVILTRNAEDFKEAKLPVLSPLEFLDQLPKPDEEE